MQKFLILTLILVNTVVSAKETPKGVLPELRIQGQNEDENQKRSLQSEVLITKSEQKAIESLIAILKRRKGSPEEPDLWYRLGELYMRRAKSGRYFDLNRDNAEAVRFAPPEVTNETASANLKRAIQIFTKIDREFPKFKDMDAVLFNAGFASQQIGLSKQAEQFYIKAVSAYPKSRLMPDTHLALGEIKYHAQDFKGALDHFNLIQKFPQSKVYTWGMYKAAWTLYNLHESSKAIDKLIEVVRYYDPKKSNGLKTSYNLRTEALRDLTLFFEETSTPEKAYSFFAAITTPEELGETLIQLGKLYESHSRHKDMNVFLADFIAREPTSPQRVKAHLLMVEANEALKNRKEVIAQFKTVDGICKKDSVWALENEKGYDEACNFDFGKANIEIAKKWWELWLKNKQHKEIADLTRQAFKIYLDREENGKADSKSRYAYSELLFQLEDFRSASNQYMKVGDRTEDSVLKHDSDYSALVALEKASAKKKEDGDDNQILALAERYLKKNPNGEHAVQVSFKIGFIHYERKNFVEAEKWLTPIAGNEKAGDLKRKSEDLVLDILNARKDYKGIKGFATKILAQTKDETRRVSLTKIVEEADYSEIQDFAKTAEKSKAADKLVQFSQSNKSSPLAKDSTWQALSLYYSGGRPLEGADLARDYAKNYPTDTRSLDGLKDAAKAYADSGFIVLAAQTMEVIAEKSPKEADKYYDAAAELYLLEGNRKLAVNLLNKLLSDKSPGNQGKIYAKILSTMKGMEKSPEYLQLEDKIVAIGQEPFASDIKLKRAEHLLTVRKPTEAFNAARSLVGSEKSVPADTRAKARLLQARVLELEFLAQSTKSTIEKLSTVLSLKTEKLDKVQTAYLEATKISQNPNVQLEALQGLNRIYKNYVETVGHPSIKTTLKPDEKTALLAELEKLTKPIADKRDGIDKKLQGLAKDAKAVRSDEIDYANLPPEATVKARIKNPTTDKLLPYLPVVVEKPVAPSFQRFMASTTKDCSFAEQDKTAAVSTLALKANACISQGSYELAEKVAWQISRNDSKSSLGTYYLSVIADLKGQAEKALWLAELSLKKGEETNYGIYQKARVLYALKDYSAANKLFVKASDLKLPANEVYLMHGTLSYAEGDCFTVIDDFANLDSKYIYNFNLGPVLAECHAQKGEMEKGFQVIKSQLSFNPNNVDLLLEAAFMNEVYQSDTAATIKAYETAGKAAVMPEMKDWISRKVEYLKGGRAAVSMVEK